MLIVRHSLAANALAARSAALAARYAQRHRRGPLRQPIPAAARRVVNQQGVRQPPRLREQRSAKQWRERARSESWQLAS